MPPKRKKAVKDIKRVTDQAELAGNGAGASTAVLLDTYQGIACRLGLKSDQEPPKWIQNLVQQTDPVSLQVVLDEALDERNIEVFREFLCISEGIRIRWMLLWRTIHRPSDSVLRLYRAWIDCRALQDLTRLHLLDCNLGAAAALALAPFWKRTQALRELQLDHNPALSESNALVTLLDGIHELRQLTKLSLAYCLLPSNSSMALAELIEAHVSLKDINLEGNRLSDSGAERLAQAVIRSTPMSQLKFLNLSHNGLHGDIRLQQMIIAASRSRHVLIVIHDVLKHELLMRPANS